MKETEGNFKEAEYAYERANEYEQVIRLNLERLNNYQKAHELFTTKSPTSSCASLLAEYCERQGTFINRLMLNRYEERGYWLLGQSRKEIRRV